MITLDIRPIPKPRLTKSDRWKKRPAVLRYWKFCDDLRLAWQEATEADNIWGDSLFSDGKVPASFHIIFGIPMPKSWSAKKKREMQDIPHQQRPDIDNLLKAFLDCLCEDDSYVYDVRCVKIWSDTPHITVSTL